MIGLLVAFATLSVGLTLGRLLLHRREQLIRTHKQCFKFHELRDRLQLLAVEHKIELQSPPYSFLEYTINLSIRNAGVMKLSQLLAASYAMDSKIHDSRNVFEEFKTQSIEAQRLFADVFEEFSKMLISNDGTTVFLALIVEWTAHRLGGAALLLARKIRSVLPSERWKVVREARKYHRFGSALNAGRIPAC
jgi:hypothetical protein